MTDVADTLTLPDVAARMHLQWQVEQFLFEEARMLDERRFNEWLGLFSVDATYRAPVRVTREEVGDAGVGDLCFFDDGYGELELRVQGLQVRSAWAEIPPSRSRRMISNVLVEPAPDGSDDVLVRSNFFVHRSRLETVEHFFSGCRRDVLRPQGDGRFQIRAREILFDNVGFKTDNISLMF
jgi:3-phenylpropionate/cinnamic acid dioxygenase small subunit